MIISCQDTEGQVNFGWACLFGQNGCDYTEYEEPEPEEDLFFLPTFEFHFTIDPSASEGQIVSFFKEAMDSIVYQRTDCANVRIVRAITANNGTGPEIIYQNVTGTTFWYQYGYNLNPLSQNPGFLLLPKLCGSRVIYDFIVEASCDGEPAQVSVSIDLRVKENEKYPTHPPSVTVNKCDDDPSDIQEKYDDWINGFDQNAFLSHIEFNDPNFRGYNGRKLDWNVRVIESQDQISYYDYSMIVNDPNGEVNFEDSLRTFLSELLTMESIEQGLDVFVQLTSSTPEGQCVVPSIGGSYFNIPPPLKRCPDDITVFVNATQSGLPVSWIIEDTCQGATFSDPPSGSFFTSGLHQVNVGTIIVGGWNCSFLVHVRDTFPPIFTKFPSDTAVTCSIFVPPYDLVASGGEVYDNSGSPFLVPRTDIQVGDTIFRTYRAKDNSGNETDSVQRILVAPDPCTLYVKEGGLGNGNSWNNALGDLQGAIDLARDGDEIWVAAGLYTPSVTYAGSTDRHKTFHIENDIKLYGGFVGTEDMLDQRDWYANQTILSGQIGNLNDQEDNAYHVMVINQGVTSSMILDGFTVEDGFGLIDGDGSMDGQGAGIYINGASPIIQHCNFHYNNSANGGAIFATNNSDLQIANCIFHLNGAVLGASAKGGAVYFHNNSDGKIYNSTFVNNVAELAGQMIYNYFSNVEIWNSIFWDGESGEDDEIEIDVSGGSYIKNNLLLTNPGFFEILSGDFRLAPTSPAREAGNNNIPPSFLQSDFENKPRILNKTIDIGAFENTCQDTLSPVFVNLQAEGKNLGINWQHAFPSLQDAIDHACDCPNTKIPEIWVAQGMYYPTEKFGGTSARHQTFYLNKDLKLFGGFAGTETQLHERNWKIYPTILSGDLGTPDLVDDNAYHVMFLDGTQETPITRECRIDGFSIQEGNANSSDLASKGGGIYNHGQGAGNASSPTVAFCTFKDNRAVTGGAMHNAGDLGESSPLVINSLFTGNSASYGGAVYNDGNQGLSLPQFINVTISKNTAGDGSGAFFNLANANVDISNSILWDNQDEIMNYFGATTLLSHCIVDDGDPDFQLDQNTFPGPANFDLDPLFINPSSGDFRLQTGSPAINGGTQGGIETTLPYRDLDFNTRFYYRVDIGAYEFHGPLCTSFINLTGVLHQDFSVQDYITVSDAQVPTGFSLGLSATSEVAIQKNFEVMAGAEMTIFNRSCDSGN